MAFFTQTIGIDEWINNAFMPIAIWWENIVFTEINIGGTGIPIVLILLIGGRLYLRFILGG